MALERMTLKRLWICLALAGLLLPPTGSAKESAANCYLFRMHNNTWGEQNVYIQSNAIRYEMLDYGITYVGTSPEWNLIGFSDQQKTFCDLGTETANNRFKLRHYAQKIEGERTTLRGLPALRVRLSSSGPGERDWLPLFAEGKGHARETLSRRRGDTKMEAICLDKLGVGSRACNAINRLMGMPASDDITIEFHEVGQSADRGMSWSLERWEKAKPSARRFVAPSGYRRLSSVEELYGSRVTKTMEELLQGMDIGRPLGKEQGNRKQP